MHFLNHLFPFTYIAILILSFFLFYLTKKDFTKPSILTIFYFFYLLFAYLGIPFLYYKSIPYYVDLKITDKSTMWLMLLLSGASLIFLLSGALTARLIAKSIYSSPEKKWEIEKNSPFFLPLLFFLISIAVFLIYLRSLDAVPLIEAIKGAEREDIAMLRFKATAGSELKHHWISLFISEFLPFLSFYFLAFYLLTKKKFILPILLVCLPIAFFAQLVDAQKAPAILFLIGLFLAVWYVRGINLSLKHLLLLGLISLLILAVLYSIFMPSSTTLNNFLNPLRRATVSQIASSYFYLKFFPEERSFLLGRSFPNPKGIFPFENYPLTVKIMDYLNPSLAPRGRSGSANTVFWAELYANFGFWPIPFISLLLGAFLYLIEFFFEKRKLSPLRTALFAWLALFLSRLSLTSLSNLTLTPPLFGILFLSLLFWSYSSFKTILLSQPVQYE